MRHPRPSLSYKCDESQLENCQYKEKGHKISVISGTKQGAHDTSTSSKSEFDSALARRKVTNLWRRLGHFFLRIRTRSESSERRERPRPRTAVATFTAVALIGSRVISTAKCRFKAVRARRPLLPSISAPFTPFGHFYLIAEIGGGANCGMGRGGRNDVPPSSAARIGLWLSSSSAPPLPF